MTRKLTFTTAISLVFLATGAVADVTPEEVWESWQAMSTSVGQELTVGSATRNGDTLEVTGVVVTYKDDLGSTFSATFDELKFKDNGDGTVEVTMSESYPMDLAFAPTDEGPSSIKLTVTQPGMTITAGGSAEATKYDFTAPTVAVTLNEVKDETGKVLDTKATLVLTETVASYLVTRAGETSSLDSSFASKAMALDISGSGDAAEGGGSGTVTVSLTNLSGATKGTFLGAEIMANMATALNNGFTTDSTFSFGAMVINADITDASGPVKLAGSATGGGFMLAVDKTRVNYGSSLNGANFTVSGPEIPFPEVSFGFGETAFNVLMPASKSDTPQDFAFLTKIVDLTVSEDIWGLFDPGATLSRDPATFILDAKGTGRWMADIMDPAYQSDGMEPPGELNSLDLTQLLVKAAGAEVAATGGLTFDNTNLESFGGVPAPDGEINVTIKGVNKLIDNLIAMGLLPDDQAMGFRMMLGMFTRPGAGPDEVTSLIEFKDGGLFANGQQLQ
ncbi:MAG: DUF2125 domain-containing protein [Tabrizicola sp.]|nr:DUF2125 domain-containing protein [Tabrizicola sp.]